jgi:O-antigen/teichoic acid export membrane protein
MNNPSPFRSLIKGAGFVFAGNFILNTVGFFYHIPVVRILGPEKYGIWQLAYTIVTVIGPLSLLGLGTGIVFYYSQAIALKKQEDTLKILVSTLKILFVSTLITVVLLQAANFSLINKYYPYEGLKTILFILAFAIPFLALEKIGESVFRSIGNARMPYQIKIFQDAIKLCIIPAALWFTSGNLTVMSSLTLLSYIAAAVYLAFLANRYIVPLKSVKWSMGGYVKKLLSYSWPLMITDYVQIFSKKIDIFFIGYFISAHAVGIYTPAVILSNLLWIVPQATTYLLFPVLNKLKTEENREEFISVSERVYKYMIYLNLPALCFIVIFSKDILSFLYGNEFSEGSLVLIILSISMFLQIFYRVAYHILVINKKTRLVMIFNIVTMLFNLIANYFMIPVYGIMGAAFATLGSSILMGIMGIIAANIIQRKFIFPTRTLGLIFLSAVILLASLLCGDRTFVLSLSLFLSYLTVVVIYGILFEKEEVVKGIALIKKRLSGAKI